MKLPMNALRTAAAAALALAAVSCTPAGPPPPSVRQQPRVLHEWYDDGGPGEVKIRISLRDQIAEFTRGGRSIGWCYVATGKEGHSTADGTYRITEKIVDKHSNRYGWIEDEFGNVIDGDASPGDPVPAGAVYVPAPMPYWMRLTSYGIGMHGGLIPEPGKPASHGCIRMPKEFVPTLFDSVKVGTQVTITHEPSRVGPGSVPSPMMDEMVGEAPRSARPVNVPAPGLL
ncbi:MAG: L,D-transpeptidase family protein [Akkermansiaceae bacterium]|nr:L,D-transpeptidase family protein [Akkermansiaceae bacterium]